LNLLRCKNHSIFTITDSNVLLGTCVAIYEVILVIIILSSSWEAMLLLIKVVFVINMTTCPQTYNVTVTRPVNITMPPVSKEVMRAGTIRFNCTATGRPQPNVTWYKDGAPLAIGGTVSRLFSSRR
jgi:hypothetical protein